MQDLDREQLRQSVRNFVALWGRNAVEMRVALAHNGQPDGRMVNSDNLALFRQYRNSVSGSAKRLVDESLGLVDEAGNMKN
jgi:hypothetical protein